MFNIILLGSSGYIGSNIWEKLKRDFCQSNCTIIVPDRKSILEVLDEEYLINNSVKLIINCLGTYDDKYYMYHLNYWIPSELCRLVDSLSARDYLLHLIHMSSIGINSPYTRGTLKSISDRRSFMSGLLLSQYELTKRCAHTNLKNLQLRNEQNNIVIYTLAQVVGQTSIFSKKLAEFMRFFPFRLCDSTTILVSPIELIVKRVSMAVRQIMSGEMIFDNEVSLTKNIGINSLSQQSQFRFTKLYMPKWLMSGIINIAKVTKTQSGVFALLKYISLSGSQTK